MWNQARDCGTDNIYLLEIMVKNIHYSYSCINLDKNLLSTLKETYVYVNFMHFPTIEIQQDTNEPCLDFNSPDINMGIGKSLMFSLNSNFFNGKQDLNIVFHVVRMCPDGCNCVCIGKVTFDLSKTFINLMKSACNAYPATKTVNQCFPLLDAQCQSVGTITVFIRLTCYGSNVTTQFMRGGNGQCSYIFKSGEKPNYSGLAPDCFDDGVNKRENQSRFGYNNNRVSPMGQYYQLQYPQMQYPQTQFGPTPMLQPQAPYNLQSPLPNMMQTIPTTPLKSFKEEGEYLKVNQLSPSLCTIPSLMKNNKVGSSGCCDCFDDGETGERYEYGKPLATKNVSPCEKYENSCGLKPNPCAAIPNCCRARPDPCGEQEDPCKGKLDPCGEQVDPCKGKLDPCGKTKLFDNLKEGSDPCAKRDPCNPCGLEVKSSKSNKPKCCIESRPRISLSNNNRNMNITPSPTGYPFCQKVRIGEVESDEEEDIPAEPKLKLCDCDFPTPPGLNCQRPPAKPKKKKSFCPLKIKPGYYCLRPDCPCGLPMVPWMIVRKNTG